MKFSERLETLIKAKNTSQKAIAEYLSIRRPSISDWKNLETIPGADIAIKLAKHLNVSVEYLITGEDESGLTPEQRGLLRNYDKLDKRDKETVLGLIETMLKKQKKEEETVYADIQSISFEVKEAEPAYPQSLKTRNRPKADITDTPKFENDVEYLDWEMIMIPYFGKTAAGEPLDINSLPDEYMPFPRQALKGRSSDYFYLKIQGYSMVNAGINEGDMVVIRKAEEPVNGEIMLVRHENASTLKKIAIKRGQTYLCWEDGTGKQLLVNSGDFQVQGVLIWITKQPKK